MINNSICLACSHFVNNKCRINKLDYSRVFYDDITNCVIDCHRYNNYIDNKKLPNYIKEFKND